MITPFKSYSKIDKNSWNVIYSEGAVQIVNGCLMLILLLYLKNKGFSDGDSARFTAARFLGVLLISFPLGQTTSSSTPLRAIDPTHRLQICTDQAILQS